MKLLSFYKKVVEFGRDRDPRKNKKAIKAYADTSILYGKSDSEINKLMVGIDIESAELLLADRIREREGLDLVVAHHPEGRAYAELSEVMKVQVDILNQAGFSREVAEKFLDERREEVKRRILPQNHTRPVDTARLLDLPLICVHTPADNHAFHFMKDLLKKEKPAKLRDMVDLLIDIPEYKEATRNSSGPRIILGNPARALGKVLIEMTGGTEGPKDIYDKLYKEGVRTLLSMHLSEEHLRKVKDANLNVIIAGHISSDTLGLNLLLDRIEKSVKKEFQVVSCSGFKRVRRNGAYS
ncbi:MAG: NGG1p interacting factor NIF3 [Candidatus Omnitrophota bacterium]